jgi:hypothetical protein
MSWWSFCDGSIEVLGVGWLAGRLGGVCDQSHAHCSYNQRLGMAFDRGGDR